MALKQENRRHRGFLAMESLVVLLIMAVTIAYTIYVISSVTAYNKQHIERQQIFNKLVSIADYVVKEGAAAESNDAIYPNLIDEQKLNGLDIMDIATRMGISKLKIGWQAGNGTCIYRLVLDSRMEIRKLYVCGSMEAA